MNYGYIVLDGRYTRYAIKVEIPSSIKTRREAVAFLDGYGFAIALERKVTYKYTQTFICFDSETGFDTETERAENKSAPAQPEIIRCKDCRFHTYFNEKCELLDTRLRFYETDKTWTEDCFCSWAERRI